MNNMQHTTRDVGAREVNKGIAHRSRATTLLFALLVMETVLVAAYSVSQIVLIEMILVKTNNETVIATYAAESALEQGAYRVRNTSATLSALSASLTLPNNGSWSRVASSTIGSLVLRPLPMGLTRGFDFYQPDPPPAGDPFLACYNAHPSAGCRESVKINIDSCDAGGDWIELGYQSIDPTTWTLGIFKTVRYLCTGSNWQQTNNDPQAALAYRLYIRYVQGTSASLSRVTVTGCQNDNGGGNCSLPGRVDITATGSYRGSTRLMDLTVPRLSPISGIFDYGVFSECSIDKDPTNPSPSC
jgi:hypothetical protein